MPDDYASRFALAILLAMFALVVALMFHANPMATAVAILVAAAAVVICPSPH
jgi:hypothetical protein